MSNEHITDEQILLAAEPFGAFQYGDAQGDKRIDFARAILALRPQAVPMTDEQAKQLLKRSDLLDMFLHIGWYSAPRKGFDENALSLIRAIEAHHGITTPKTDK